MPIPEEWRPVVGWEGFYEVSSHGRVRSLDREIHVNASWYKPAYLKRQPGRIRRPSHDAFGYPQVRLKAKAAPDLPQRAETLRIHVLVAAAFIGPCPPGHEVAHNDGNPANCWFTNLRYATPRENNSDKESHGTLLAGERAPWAKLTQKQVDDIRRSTLTQQALADRYGVHRSNISAIRRGKSWNP